MEEVHPQIRNLQWAAVDLDGTLFEGVWTSGNPDPRIGKPMWKNIAKCVELFEAGYEIVIHTARPWSDFKAISRALEATLCPTYLSGKTPLADFVSSIQCGKVLAKVYIDDRALNASAKSWIPK